MIRLTLNAKSEPEIHLFNKSTVIIGSEAPEVDIPLAELQLQPVHVKISEQNGFLIIINVANDPFVSLNGHPFGKKLLKSGDIIVVHDVEILFENLSGCLEKEQTPTEQAGKQIDKLEKILDNQMKAQEPKTQKVALNEKKENTSTFFNISLPFEKDVEAFKEEEWQSNNLDFYVKEMEKNSLKKDLSSFPKGASKLEDQKKPTSLKDDYLREWDDDNQNLSLGLQPTEQNHLYQAWKWIIFFIFSVMTITGIIGTVIYLTVSDSTEAQEIKVAQGMSDVAMALMHAQLRHLKPHNQNWSDVDFIKSNLQAILPNSFSYASEIDAQGQFNCCAYSLRIYTSSDLSHFLLIAQPAPSLLHWLIPKSIILVDSQAMELRTVKDLRSLNRLLASSEPLEGVNGKEIHSLVKQGELIRLASLAHEERHTDFVPPKNLAWIRNEAENFIYNAPRYYRLSQELIQKSITLTTSKGTSRDVAVLKQEMESFTRLHHLVLYAEQGKKSALLAKQGIMTFAPSDKVLFGYLVFNAQGKIHQVHLLKEEEEFKEHSALVPVHNKDKEVNGEQIAFQSHLEKPNKEERLSRLAEDQKLIDTNHPIYIQLSSLASARENELRSLSQPLTEMLQEEIRLPSPEFQEKFQIISHQYLMADIKYKERIKEALSILYYQYEEMPITQFIQFVKHAGFNSLIQQNEHSFTLVDESCIQNLESTLTHIQNAKTLMELDNLTHISCSWLNFDYIKNPQDLIRYQNLLRNTLLSQLEKLLLSYQKHIEFPHLKSEEKHVLEHILSRERLIQPEERDYFLQEFDHLFENHILTNPLEDENSNEEA
jgi:hypothetical protein